MLNSQIDQPLMNSHSQDRFASAAHIVFDTWSESGTPDESTSIIENHSPSTIPNLRGRVLHVVIHQVQLSVSAEVIDQVFPAYGDNRRKFSVPSSAITSSCPFFVC
ncbi:hypothetical protein VPH35_014108 [Triticum aestivum]|uniref:Uncharacterized protein n=1 Tax=Aegilops tauschii subsp. strangulata TaxID=200361 RepID=A0A452YED2_AEGTS